MLFSVRNGILVAAAVMTASVASDAQANDDDRREAAGAAVAGDDDARVGTEPIFGFTEGSDPNDLGEKQLTIDFVGRATRRPEGGNGRYRALSGGAEFEYGVTADFEVSVSASLDYHRVRNIVDAEDVSRLGFNGLGAQAKWRLLDREDSPVGFAIAVEPEWSRYEEGSGERVESYGFEARLLADAEIVPDQAFVATNLVFTPEWARAKVENEATGTVDKKLQRESSLELSAAVAGRAAANAFVGAEARFVQGFSGVSLNARESRAFYVGPTFYLELSKQAYLKAAWSYQVAGKSEERPQGRLDLVNYDRHQVRLSLAYEF